MSGGQRSPEVMVVLSAYNGARHIAEQIDSIRGQSFREWKLVVRDDGSSDGTIGIVKDFVARDARISLIEDSGTKRGPWASFGKLLAHAYDHGAEHVFLSDQDDVWLPGKMEQQLSLLTAEAARRGARHPLLVHSDLEVVDEALRLIHPSFSEFQRMSYNKTDPLRTLLIHNAVVGCSVAINRPLLEFALPIPSGSPHDWWLALCAAATGGILRTAAPTVLYRQHTANVVGAVPRHAFVRELMRHPLSYTASAFRTFNVGVEQARHLRDRMRLEGFGDKTVLARVDRYCDAFAEDGTLTARLRALRESRARPQRAVSRIILYGLAAAFPKARSSLKL
jgi:glycosyltransferase involved in cell wall biosynthesis